MKYPILFFGICILSLTVACNGPNSGNGDYGEGGGLLENNAFNNAFTESAYFAKWDSDQNGKVDENEFYHSYVSTMDDNGDGQINAEEWEIGLGAYYRGFDQEPEGKFEEIATNSNGQISNEEARNKLIELDYLDEWNTDGEAGLTEEELAKGVFYNLDEDGDGIVEAEKYTDYFNKYEGS